MKTLPVVLSFAMFVGFAQQLAGVENATPSASAKDPVKWGAGCNAALLAGEFTLAKAPELPLGNEQKAFIERVINEVKGGYGGTMVVEDPSHPHMDKPEFVARYLRAFGDPGDSFKNTRRSTGPESWNEHAPLRPNLMPLQASA